MFPDWIACRVISFDFEFPAYDITSLYQADRVEVSRGLVMVLQLAPLYLSQSAKVKEREIEREKLKEQEKEKENFCTLMSWSIKHIECSFQ